MFISCTAFGHGRCVARLNAASSLIRRCYICQPVLTCSCSNICITQVAAPCIMVNKILLLSYRVQNLLAGDSKLRCPLTDLIMYGSSQKSQWHAYMGFRGHYTGYVECHCLQLTCCLLLFWGILCDCIVWLWNSFSTC